MTKIAAKEAKKRLDSLLDDAISEHRPVTIERLDGGAAVLLEISDYEGLLETAHLLSSPANAQRLLRSLAEAEAGDLAARDPL